MSNDQSIIGIARMFLDSNVDLGDGGEMRGIAEALLTREAALKEAREALERIAGMKILEPQAVYDAVAMMANEAEECLARLKEIVPE